MKRLVVNFCKYVLGFLLLGIVVWRNWQPESGIGIAEALQRPLQAGALTLAALSCTIGILITFVRWWVLVRAQELTFSLLNAMRLGLMGFFFSTFLPGSVGGDILKAAFIAREQSRRTVAVATVLVDRVIGLLGLFWLVALLGTGFWLAGDPTLVRHVSLQWVLLGSYGVIVACLVGWLLLGILSESTAEEIAQALWRRIPKVGVIFSELWRAAWMYRRKGGTILLTILMSVVGHVFFVLSFYYSALVFLEPGQASQLPNVPETFLIVPVGMTIQAAFPTPGGLGGGEYGFGKLYQLVGKPEANGVLAALVARMIYWVVAFVGYLLYLQTGRISVKDVDAENNELSGDVVTA